MISHTQSVRCDRRCTFYLYVACRDRYPKRQFSGRYWFINQSTPCTCCVAGRTSTEWWLYGHKRQQQQQNVLYKWSPLLIPLQTVVWCIYRVTETAVWRTEAAVRCFYSHEQQRYHQSSMIIHTLRKCAFDVCVCMYYVWVWNDLVDWLSHTHTHTHTQTRGKTEGI